MYLLPSLYFLSNRQQVMGHLGLKGPCRQKITHMSKKFFSASKEVSTCSRCCCEFLQLCNKCEWGLVGVKRHYSPAVFKKYGAEKSFTWKVSILQLLKSWIFTVFELQDWNWYQKKRNFAIYKVTESFLQICFSEKNWAVWNLSLLAKKEFFS